MSTQSNGQPAMTLSDHMRRIFKGVLDPIAGFLNRLGLTPNMVTFLGLAGSCVGALFIARGEMTIAGFVILLAGPIDALDGAMARLRGEPSDFGGFIDSVTDRYSELLIFGGLVYHFFQQNDLLAVMLTFTAAAGSVLVSYVKARAEGLGFQAKVGMLTRLERYIVLIPSLVFNVPIVAMWIMAVFTNFTALQRILHVRAQAHREMKTGRG
ncbi:MAG: CDP-alcohol phosphatidyltransferase family protein [Chloroflexota bacterium]